MTPPAQLRALLLIDGAGRLNLTRLAGWVRGQRQAAIARALTGMSPEGRRHRARGRADLADPAAR